MRTLFQLKWDFLAIVLVSIGLYAVSTEFSTVVRKADHPTESGSRPPDRLEGDVLLLLPDNPSDRARSFDEIDTSYVWYNLLWQHVGTFASVKLKEMSPELLAGRATVIVPKSVAGQMTEIGFNAISTFVDSGGIVVVEMPTNAWAKYTQLTVAGNPRKATYAELVWNGQDVEVALTGERFPVSDERLDPDRILMRVDEAPGVITTTSGRGMFVSVAFDFARSLMAIQQGAPDDGMKFEERPTHSRSRSGPQKIPVADLLELALIDGISELRPLPKIWRYPGSYKGAAIVLHPMFGDEIAKARTLNSDGLGTLFLPSDRRNDGYRACVWSDDGRYTTASDMFGVFETRTEIPANVQLDGCHAGIALDFVWQKEWIRSLRRFAAAETYVDFSLTSKEAGFGFGTTYPFYPIDDRGLPLPVLTMPILLRDAQLEKISEFIEPSLFSSPITVSVSVESMTQSPSAAILRELSILPTYAEQHELWLTTPLDFIAFVSARRQSVVTSRWFDDDRRLVISARIQKALDIASTSLAIPVLEFGIESIIVDGEVTDLKSDPVEGHRIVVLSEGRHTVEVIYQRPESEDLDSVDLE